MGTVILAVAMIVCARWFFRSELSHAMADSLRENRRRVGDDELVDRIDELSERMQYEIGSLRAEVTEISERVDFAERLLADRGREQLTEPETH